MKKITFILFLLIISGCKPHKDIYSTMKNYIEEETNSNREFVYLSIRPQKYDYPINTYGIAKKHHNTEKMRLKSYIKWEDKKYAWLFNDEDFEYIKQKHLDSTPGNFTKKELKRLGLKLSYKNLKEISKEHWHELTILSLSKPVFNKDKTKCMLWYSRGSYMNHMSGDHIILFIKEKGKWKKAGIIYDTILH